MSKNNTFLTNSLYFITPQVTGKIIAILTLPILLAILDKSTYGEIAFLLGIQQILFTIVSNGNRQTVLKFFSDASQESRSEIIRSSSMQSLFRCISFLILALVVNILFELNYSSSLVVIIFLGILLMSFEALYDSLMIATNLIETNSKSNILKSVFSPILIVFFVFLNPQVEVYFLALCITFGIKLTYSFLKVNINLQHGNNSINKKEVSQYSANMMVLNSNQKISKWSDRILLGLLISQESLGEYHAVLQLVLALEFISNGLITTFKTHLFSSQKKNGGSNYKLFQDLVFLIFMLAIIGATLRFNLGTAILEEEYWGMLSYIPFLALSIFINTVFKLLSVVADKQTSFINYKKISTLTVFANIFLSLIGLYFFEIRGLIAAIIITYVLKLILLYKDKNFLEKPKINIQKLFFWSFLFVNVEFVSYFIGNAGEVTLRWLFSLVGLFYAAEKYVNLKKYV